MRARLSLWLILVAYFPMGTLFAIFTPDWESPDEPAHYNYIRQLADGQLPVIEPGDYDQAFLTEVVFQSHFAPEYSLESIEYEDWQPPLYYLLLTPIFLLTGGSLLALRLFTLVLGAVVVVLAFEITHRIFPARPWLATISATFIAFLPQHLAILSSVNNDSLAELLIAAILLRMISLLPSAAPGRSQQIESRNFRLLGLLLGFGFVTKGTVYPLALLVALLLLRCSWGDWRSFVRAGLNVYIPALALGSLWWVRNLIVYGGLDFLARAAHDAVVSGQPSTADLIAAVGLRQAVWSFAQTTFNSFWGQFGWMTVPFPPWTYQLLWLFSGLVLLGLLAAFFDRSKTVSVHSRDSIVLLAILFALTLGVHVAYNVTFQQHQGRYLFPALVPIAVGVALGFNAWLKTVRQRYVHAVVGLPLLLALALITFDIWALFGVIIPALG
jgi:4-amino-4-deoxy-L-arabinose transferase-like glycosyltransferase